MTIKVPEDQEQAFLDTYVTAIAQNSVPRANRFQFRQELVSLRYCTLLKYAQTQGESIERQARLVARAYKASVAVELGRNAYQLEGFSLTREGVAELVQARQIERTETPYKDLVKDRFAPSLISKEGWSEVGYIRVLRNFFGYANGALAHVRGRQANLYMDILTRACHDEGVRLFHQGLGEDFFWHLDHHLVEPGDFDQARVNVPYVMPITPAQREAVARDDEEIRRGGLRRDWNFIEWAHLAWAYRDGECSDLAAVKLQTPVFSGSRTSSSIKEQAKNMRRNPNTQKGRKFTELRNAIIGAQPRGFFDLPTLNHNQYASVRSIVRYIQRSKERPEEEALQEMAPNPLHVGPAAVPAPGDANAAQLPRRMTYQEWLDGRVAVVRNLNIGAANPIVNEQFGLSGRLEQFENVILDHLHQHDFPLLARIVRRREAHADDEIAYSEYLSEKYADDPTWLLAVPQADQVPMAEWSRGQLAQACFFRSGTVSYYYPLLNNCRRSDH